MDPTTIAVIVMKVTFCACAAVDVVWVSAISSYSGRQVGMSIMS